MPVSNATTSDTEEDFIIDEGVSLTPNIYDHGLRNVESTTKRKRGRPRKLTQTFFFDRSVNPSSKNSEAAPRKRGRPRKEKQTVPPATAPSPSQSDRGSDISIDRSSLTSYRHTRKSNALVEITPKCRGRPPKRSHVDVSNITKDRSSPAKNPPQILSDVVNVPNSILNNIEKRKRGRPRKTLNNIPNAVVAPVKKQGKRGRPKLHDIARPVSKSSRTSERIRRSARVISSDIDRFDESPSDRQSPCASPHVLKNKTTMILPLDIPVSQIDPNFSKEEALSDLSALYNTVPDEVTYLFHAQVKGFIITLKEIVPHFNRDSSPRI